MSHGQHEVRAYLRGVVDPTQPRVPQLTGKEKSDAHFADEKCE